MATRVKINKALETELRECAKQGDNGYKWANDLIEQIIKLLDEEQERAAGSKSPGKEKSGLGYQELVALFRSYLGHSLLTPPKPNVSYIIKIVNKAKEQGLAYDNVEQILAGLRRAAPRGPYRLADIIYNLDRYYALGTTRVQSLQSNSDDAEDKSAGGEDSETDLELGRSSDVWTGRPESGSSDD